MSIGTMMVSYRQRFNRNQNNWPQDARGNQRETEK